jgi:hypothetical protein
MAIQVIQGYFLGGAMRMPVPGPPAVVQRVPPLPLGLAPGRPTALHRLRHVAQAPGGSGSFAIDPVRIGLARRGGEALPQPLLARMEAAFETDFSAVRVHIGPQPSRIGAIAFTAGDDLYFAPGQFQPATIDGQWLIGHELAHVIQQREGRVRSTTSGLAVVQDPTLEAEAERLALRAAHQRLPAFVIRPRAADLAAPGH